LNECLGAALSARALIGRAACGRAISFKPIMRTMIKEETDGNMIFPLDNNKAAGNIMISPVAVLMIWETLTQSKEPISR